MQCHPATELGSGIEMPVPCIEQISWVPFLDAKTNMGRCLFLGCFRALVELITIKKRCLSMQTRY